MTAISGLPQDLRGVWKIEHTAMLPEFRATRLSDRLFEQARVEGRSKGFSRAQIRCLIGY
jgi:hypothetical protein